MSNLVIMEDKHIEREQLVHAEVIEYHHSQKSPVSLVIASPTSTQSYDDQPASPLSTQRGDESASSPMSSQREEGDGEEEANSDPRQKMDLSLVRFYTPCMDTFRELLDDLPPFANGKKLSWFQRHDQQEIDASWIELNEDGENVLVNLRKNQNTGLWENMNDHRENLTFTDCEELLKHARSWPIPVGHYRDYTVMWGNAKGLMRIYG